MKKEFKIMYCYHCKRHYRYNDPVVLDAWNSILHASCYEYLTEYPIIDKGTYGEIIEKYDFFKELR
ncbi:hypothetical protein [Oceanobacillus luteolus]|uniref:Uncharacterized protein n=1 Tax=Oceanobacillus luteolus TaxID=1274358 RepID=A0ABW4HQP7_9BACI